MDRKFGSSESSLVAHEREGIDSLLTPDPRFRQPGRANSQPYTTHCLVMGTRRESREYALQMLYQWDLRRDDLDATMRTFWEVNTTDDDVRQFADRLVRGTVEHLDEIDTLILRHARHWRLDRMETLDRNLLRMAIGEFLSEDETPSTVVINEAIEIARRYSTQGSPQFVNGLLDSIRQEIENR